MPLDILHLFKLVILCDHETDGDVVGNGYGGSGDVRAPNRQSKRLRLQAAVA